MERQSAHLQRNVLLLLLVGPSMASGSLLGTPNSWPQPIGGVGQYVTNPDWYDGQEYIVVGTIYDPNTGGQQGHRCYKIVVGDYLEQGNDLTIPSQINAAYCEANFANNFAMGDYKKTIDDVEAYAGGSSIGCSGKDRESYLTMVIDDTVTSVVAEVREPQQCVYHVQLIGPAILLATSTATITTSTTETSTATTTTSSSMTATTTTSTTGTSTATTTTSTTETSTATTMTSTTSTTTTTTSTTSTTTTTTSSVTTTSSTTTSSTTTAGSGESMPGSMSVAMQGGFQSALSAMGQRFIALPSLRINSATPQMWHGVVAFAALFLAVALAAASPLGAFGRILRRDDRDFMMVSAAPWRQDEEHGPARELEME